MLRTLIAVLLAFGLAACGESGPEGDSKADAGPRILPETVGLKVADGDQLTPCAEDGASDNTPDADCVLTSAANPMEPYASSLKMFLWVRTMAFPDGSELWLRPTATSGRCQQLSVTRSAPATGGGDQVLLRFSVKDNVC
ncbi:MAG: hypothetical protein R3C46_14345 [Hyphomonadaceae bacterium]